MVEWLNVQRSPSEIFGRQDRAWKDFMQDCTSWVKIDHVRGGDTVKRVYGAVAKWTRPRERTDLELMG